MTDKYDDKLERAYALARGSTDEAMEILLRELIDRVQALESNPKRTRFEKPGTWFVEQFFLTNDSNLDEAHKFVDFYESKNWMVGKTKMKDWKAAARNWIRRNNDEKRTGSNGSTFTRESKSERATRVAQEHLADPDSI